jgi:GAF domain-containing protein
MAENLIISQGGKAEKYATLYPQIKSLTENESDPIANMANISAMLHETFGFWWTGFYRVCRHQENEAEILVLGPFQGPLACSRIRYGKGVCGTAWAESRTVIVPDVDLFPGHIACSSLSRSEIVIPVYKEDTIIAVLDIDSAEKDTFDQTDKEWLERIVGLL